MYYTEQFNWGLRLQNGKGTSWFQLLSDFILVKLQKVILFILINIGRSLLCAVWNCFFLEFCVRKLIGLFRINEFAAIL